MERTNEIKSDTFYFTTLDSEKETATFACWNDTHENDETIKQLTSLLENQKPDFLIWNGDITNDIFDEDQIVGRSEEHTSELQSRGHLVCRLLLEKKNKL